MFNYDLPDLTPYWATRDTVIQLEDIEFDYEGTQGQARPLDPALASKMMTDLVKNPPETPIDCKLWEVRAGVKRSQVRARAQKPEKCYGTR